jgi:RNA polymerase sigma-70 factor (ECF subfamily)
LTTSEGQWLDRARQYDAQALAEIYDRFAEPIYRYLYRYLGDAAQAEDLTSEVFLRLLHNINTSRGPRDHLSGWLYRVAHNLAMDWYRKHGKNETLPLDLDDGDSLIDLLPSDEELPADQVERQQTQEQVRGAIQKLTPEQQQVILLRFGEGLKIAEVSQIMDKSTNAVKVLQHRAIRQLKKRLEQDEKKRKR